MIPSAYLRGGAAEHALHTVTALAWAGDTSEDGLEETPEVVGVSDTVCMKIDGHGCVFLIISSNMPIHFISIYPYIPYVNVTRD